MMKLLKNPSPRRIINHYVYYDQIEILVKSTENSELVTPWTVCIMYKIPLFDTLPYMPGNIKWLELSLPENTNL